jgi:hypothetical protein
MDVIPMLCSVMMVLVLMVMMVMVTMTKMVYGCDCDVV